MSVRGDIKTLRRQVDALLLEAHRHPLPSEQPPARRLEDYFRMIKGKHPGELVVVERWELDELLSLLNSSFTIESRHFPKGDSVLLTGVIIAARGTVVQ